MSTARRIGALGISVGSVGLLVTGLAALQQLGNEQPLPPAPRRIDIAAPAPPPPPPPPSTNQEPADPSLKLELSEGSSSSLRLPKATVDPGLKVENLARPIARIQPMTFDINVNADMQEFGLAQLDNRPRLLTELKVSFPQSLRSRGITSVRVRVQVVIDQTGSVTLREIVENPHAELEPQIRALVRRARFTSPEKDGQKVRAAFVWPMVLTAS
ncbi:MAG: TonB family protein [Pseudomonadota bacterium]